MPIFGDPKEMAKAIVGGKSEEPEVDGKEAAAQELIDAVKAQDAAAVVVAFRALFDLLEVEPHEEYENESE